MFELTVPEFKVFEFFELKPCNTLRNNSNYNFELKLLRIRQQLNLLRSIGTLHVRIKF